MTHRDELNALSNAEFAKWVFTLMGGRDSKLCPVRGMTTPRFWVQEKSPSTGDKWKEIYTTNSRADASIYIC